MSEVKSWSCEARARVCARASVSLKGAPRSSGAFWRIEGGNVSAISASRLGAPTVSSIAATSRGEGPIWRAAEVVAASLVGLNGAFMTSSRDVLGVGGFIHQPAEFAFVRDLQLEEPGFATGIGIDQRGRRGERLIDIDDFT